MYGSKDLKRKVDMDSTLKLIPDLIPKTSFFVNLRSILTPEEWDVVRRATYSKAGHKCEFCGASGMIHCHEVWVYDEATAIQKLVRLVAVCPACHEVFHLGLAEVKGRLKEALAHMMKVNGIGHSRALIIAEEAFRIWRQRSQITWTLDVSALDSLIEKG
jgi:hypothetical protein